MAYLHTPLLILLGALLAEAAFGYPKALYAAIRHPVVWMGGLIAALERRLNILSVPFAARRRRGVLGLVLLLLAVGLPTAALQIGLLALLPWGVAVGLLALLAATLPAQRSLYEHVAAVADALEGPGDAAARLAAGQRAVSMIVGRDTAVLDEAGVVRAAIESLAENFSDGVVAPSVWCGVAGLPGIALYKAINTADSMVGHRNERYAAYGWASARLDDIVNLPASRLAALWIGLAALLLPGVDARGAWRAVWRDARQHRSPNAGWPEAAMAGALGLRLAGPRIYGAVRVEDHWMGDGRAAATPADLRRALHLYRLACSLPFFCLAAFFLAAAVGW